jgi:hypothetical protein
MEADGMGMAGWRGMRVATRKTTEKNKGLLQNISSLTFVIFIML